MLRVVTPQDKDQVLELATKTFSQHEPMTKAGGKSYPEMLQLFGPITDACCNSGMSFAVEQRNDTGASTIVSVSMALPFSTYNEVQWPDVPRPARVILDTLPDLTAAQEASGVYLFLWATHGDHMGRGYSKLTVAASLEAARQAGYVTAVVDATNVVSQHIAMSHFGFKPMDPKARYKDHKLYKGVQCSEYIVRAVKDLTAGPEQQQQQQ
jgi:hypothetical protein